MEYGYTNVLTAYLDTNPTLKVVVYSVGAFCAAVVVHSWMQRREQAVEASLGVGSGAGPAKRRRDPACVLAILPDGSKDRSDREWRRVLPPNRYASLRAAETDPPNLPADEGGIEDFLEDGVFLCAGCGAMVYDNDARYDAGCGWPCFFTCVENAVRERRDADGTRMELICNACNSHLGHIFRGEHWPVPPPGERHCVNSRSLVFAPEHIDDEELDEIDESPAAQPVQGE
jgi:peptide-methionine (R)-S-oxide reductase